MIVIMILTRLTGSIELRVQGFGRLFVLWSAEAKVPAVLRQLAATTTRAK